LLGVTLWKESILLFASPLFEDPGLLGRYALSASRWSLMFRLSAYLYLQGQEVHTFGAA